jgi:hypothetical protein
MEENVENVVEETTQATEQPVEETKKPKVNEDGDRVVDLSKPKENETKEDNLDDKGVVRVDENADATEKQEEVQPEEQAQEETPVLEEVTDEETTDEAKELTEELIDAKIEEAETGKTIPENLQKVVDFMEETGGTLEDYVKLNQDYSKLENQDLLFEYYKQTKPHLNNEEINFLMEDQFSFNEDEDEERDVRRKKLALKEQVASAKAHLDGQKSKYYEEIKAGSKLTQEQQKAVNFFNRYNKESEVTKKAVDNNTKIFEQKTNNLFNDKFKGFEYQVGEKKFRFNVKDVDSVKKTQSDSNNFMTKFVDKNSTLKDAKGYHKSLFTAMNADAIANHFYEQGKTDAMKDSVAKAKNVNMSPRQQHGVVEAGGMKVKVLGDNSSDFKFKIKQK